jgi:acetate kinase
VDFGGGFSGQSGLEGATRSGEFDAFGMTYLIDRENLSTTEIRDILCRNGGLLGISGLSGDMRDLEEAAAKGHQRAALAIDVFVYHVKKYLGSFAAAMGGMDVLSFAGGIGENSPNIRRRVCEGLEFLGVHLDEEKNRAPAKGDRVLSTADSPVPIVLVYTNEEIIVARETAKLLEQARAA